MPQSSNELREKWGGRSGVGEDKACDFLEARGYVLTDRFCWFKPEGLEPTENDLEALTFLAEEWDFGWITNTMDCRCHEEEPEIKEEKNGSNTENRID